MVFQVKEEVVGGDFLERLEGEGRVEEGGRRVDLGGEEDMGGAGGRGDERMKSCEAKSVNFLFVEDGAGNGFSYGLG